jgi:predicted small lipoprotein YifL
MTVMPMYRRILPITLILLFITASQLSACGQKGDLYRSGDGSKQEEADQGR